MSSGKVENCTATPVGSPGQVHYDSTSASQVTDDELGTKRVTEKSVHWGNQATSKTIICYTLGRQVLKLTSRISCQLEGMICQIMKPSKRQVTLFLPLEQNDRMSLNRPKC
ncbi:hypothetical protein EUGRSUZ_E03720 [Eucalyptus grandis]|uniref:Uncharacterized protein n=2 Tax=Eucalyptus grandis TaxID=71139 RepID=A0ACC3KZP2_EUCGR|nr:hypothetical protein EUGRSUZ_E03720 [Eucalyptus grandis]